MEERRSEPRIRAYHPVRLQKPGSPEPVQTLTKDLSVGGLRCLTPSLLPVSTVLGIELVLASGDEVFTARGKTVWFRTIPNSDQFDVGIAFEGLLLHDKRRLSVYLDRLSRHATPVSA